MSRKYNRTLQVNKKVLEIIQAPETLFHLGSQLIRKKPKLMPRFMWKALLRIVLAPAAKKAREKDEPQSPNVPAHRR